MKKTLLVSLICTLLFPCIVFAQFSPAANAILIKGKPIDNPSVGYLYYNGVKFIYSTPQAADTDLTSLAGGVTGIVKGAGDGGGYSAATAGTDFCGPAPVVDLTAAVPTAAQLKCGAVLRNAAWTSGAVARTLPAIEVGMSFFVEINVTQTGPTTHTLTSAAGNNMRLDRIVSGKDYISFATPTAGNAYSCRAFLIGASLDWDCYTLNGTPAGGDL